MNRFSPLLLGASAFVLCLPVFSAEPADKPVAKPSATAKAMKLPLVFEENRGQTEEAVRFGSLFAGGQAEFRESEVRFVLDATQQSPARIALVDSSPNVAIRGVEQLASYSNHYKGNDPAKWVEGNPHYARVVYEEVYPGIDWVWYGSENRFEYDFRVAPGADPGQAKVAFGAQDELTLAENGDLLVRTGEQEMRFLKPVVYQQAASGRAPIDGEYTLLAENRVGFALGGYDATRELVIDPVLGYSTYFGDGRDEEDTSVVTGADGSTYVSFTGGNDVVLLKLSPTAHPSFLQQASEGPLSTLPAVSDRHSR